MENADININDIASRVHNVSDTYLSTLSTQTILKICFVLFDQGDIKSMNRLLEINERNGDKHFSQLMESYEKATKRVQDRALPEVKKEQLKYKKMDETTINDFKHTYKKIIKCTNKGIISLEVYIDALEAYYDFLKKYDRKSPELEEIKNELNEAKGKAKSK